MTLCEWSSVLGRNGCSLVGVLIIHSIVIWKMRASVSFVSGPTAGGAAWGSDAASLSAFLLLGCMSFIPGLASWTLSTGRMNIQKSHLMG